MSVNNAGSFLPVMKRIMFPSSIVMKRIMFPFVNVLLALLMLIALFLEIQLVSLSLLPSPIEDHRMMSSTIPTASASSERVPLYIITASGRPAILTRGLFHMLPFLDEENNCGFDVHWIIVHNFPDARLTKAPLFRNVFPWITELFAYNAFSDYGDHERNVAIEHILSFADTGLVYYLDDDNVLPLDLCRVNAQSPLSTDLMYYADMYTCGKPPRPPALPASRFTSQWRKGANNLTLEFNLFNYTDTANWLTPLWLYRQEYYGGGTQGPNGVRWKLQKRPGSDGLFFTGIVKSLLQTDGTENRLVQLPPTFHFKYNYLKDCSKPNGVHYYNRGSLNLYRQLIRDMKDIRKSEWFLSPEKKTSVPEEVASHDYAYILHGLRSASSKKVATYVEIGVSKGASCIFMSRHPKMFTNIIGIGEFALMNQWEEVEEFARHLKGNSGYISFIKSDSKLALPKLRELLNNGTGIDILFIAGNRSVEGIRTDFELYEPLVSERGFIIFDGFMDTANAPGVREAVVRMIRNGRINTKDYEVIGSVPNTLDAHPSSYDKHLYDWQSQASNLFLIRKW